MCYHRSFIVTEDEKVLSHPKSDHHTEIRALHKIREQGFHHTPEHAAIEFRPVSDLFNLKGWDFVVDQPVKPTWWTTRHQKAVMDRMEVELKRFTSVDSKVYYSESSLELPYLKRLPTGAHLVSEGRILLNDGHFLHRNIIIADSVTIAGTPPSEMAKNLIITDCLLVPDPETKKMLEKTGQWKRRNPVEQLSYNHILAEMEFQMDQTFARTYQWFYTPTSVPLIFPTVKP